MEWWAFVLAVLLVQVVLASGWAVLTAPGRAPDADAYSEAAGEVASAA